MQCGNELCGFEVEECGRQGAGVGRTEIKTSTQIRDKNNQIQECGLKVLELNYFLFGAFLSRVRRAKGKQLAKEGELKLKNGKLELKQIPV